MWDNFLMIQEFIINNGLYKETSDIFLSAVFTILERENEIIITAYKMGNFLDSKVEGLDTELSGLLSLDITKKNIFADRVEYVFEKNKREIQQYVFANSDSKENLTREFFQSIPKDIIKLSNTQQFSLKRNTNIGLYGRTGSGKTVTLQWLLYNAISKGCGLYPDTYLSIVDGKGADLYSLGEILQETLGEQINIVHS